MAQASTALEGAEVNRAPNKFGAIATEVDGIRFASKKEARRYRELSLLEKAGQIHRLRLQVRYPLVVNGVKIGHYTADFVYTENGAEVVEDSKGVRTRDYILRAKLMRALYGVTILET